MPDPRSPETAVGLRNSLRYARGRLLPQCCFFCADQGPSAVCAPCAEALSTVDASACPRCQLPSVDAQVCGRCLRRAPSWQRLHACWQYQFPLDQLILGIKYQHRFALLRWIAEQQTHWPFAANALLLPVPLSTQRQAMRGFNQALVLAQELARRFRVPLDADAFIRIRNTEVQQGLGYVARRRNVRDAFAATRPLDGQSVVLIDDVMTSGATLNELARMAYAAGAQRVDAWVVARTPALRKRERVLKSGRLPTS